MATTPSPSLFARPGQATAAPPSPSMASSQRDARDLMDLMYNGFYMIFLLRNGHAPSSAEEFAERIRNFLSDVERGAQKLQVPAEDTYLAKFAYCALVDEVVLASRLGLREAWAQRPLQLHFFGEHMAGERFFIELETLRQAGKARLQVLEVFHMCLLLGFQGRYALEDGTERLSFLTARVGEEIAQHRGKRAPFAPHWAAPDSIAHKLRSEVPLWVIGSVFALLAALAFVGLNALLRHQTQNDLGQAANNNIIKLAPQAAHVTITLP